MRIVIYIVLSVVLLVSGCADNKPVDKDDLSFDSIDVTFLLGWRGGPYQIKVDKSGEVQLVVIDYHFKEKANEYYSLTMEKPELDSISSLINKIDLSKVFDTEGDDCNRCLLYHIVIKKDGGYLLDSSFSGDVNSDYEIDRSKLNNLIIYLSRTDVFEKSAEMRNKFQFESKLERLYPEPLID